MTRECVRGCPNSTQLATWRSRRSWPASSSNPGCRSRGIMIPSVGALLGRDFLDVADLDAAELRQVLDLAHAIKAGRWAERPLERKHIAMLFQKPSHRTRVSFEVGIARLGGTATTLTEQDVQLGVRETIRDAARVLDRYVDGIVARLRTHGDIVELAAAAEKPVINALTDRSHPCQILADLMTLEEICGPLQDQRVVYIRRWQQHHHLPHRSLCVARFLPYAHRTQRLRGGFHRPGTCRHAQFRWTQG